MLAGKYTYKNQGFEKRIWTAEEVLYLSESWKNPDISVKAMSNKLKRSVNAVKLKADKLGLGKRDRYNVYLTTADVCKIFNITNSTLKRWCYAGLKRCKSRISDSSRNWYDIDDILKFLEKHQDKFDASTVDIESIYRLPDWFKLKLREDLARIDKTGDEWTTLELVKLKSLHLMGYNDIEIGDVLRRSSSAVKCKRVKMGLYRKDSFTEREVEILKEYAPIMKLTEISEKYMHNKPLSTLSRKCKMLGIETYYSKRMKELKWEDSEVIELEKLIKDGYTDKEIGDKLGRAKGSIRFKRKELGYIKF